jgi:hypothetical protein
VTLEIGSRKWEFDLLLAPGQLLVRLVRAAGTGVLRQLGRLLPRQARATFAALPGWWAVRGERHRVRHSLRMLRRLHAEIRRQDEGLRAVEAELAMGSLPRGLLRPAGVLPWWEAGWWQIRAGMRKPVLGWTARRLDAALRENRERARVITDFLQDPTQSVAAMGVQRELGAVQAELAALDKRRTRLAARLRRIETRPMAVLDPFSRDRLRSTRSARRAARLHAELCVLGGSAATRRARERELHRRLAAFAAAPPLAVPAQPTRRWFGRTREGPASGAVLDGEWGAGQQDRWERVLPRLEAFGTSRHRDPANPRAPPAVLEIPLSPAVLDLLDGAGLADLPGRLAGYYWADRDVVVIFALTLHRLHAAGLLERLLAHEDFFHRQGRLAERNAAGLTHDEDAAEIVELLAAGRPRTRRARGSGPAAPAARRGGTGALAVLTPRERELARSAYEAVRGMGRRPERDERVASDRGAPGEEVFVPLAPDVRRALERLGATPTEVGRILRAWAFAWRDAEGVLVVAVFADRLAELERLRLVQRVLLHERRDVTGGFGSAEAHDRDVDVVQRTIRAAQVAAGGRSVAELGGLPLGWSGIGDGAQPVPGPAVLETQLHEVRAELANAVRAAADTAGVAIRVDSVAAALDEARRRTEGLRSTAGHVGELLGPIDTAESEIAALRLVLALLIRWRTEGSLSPGFWAAGMEVLAARRALPAGLRTLVVLLLARSVQRLFTRAEDLEWGFLERPRLVDDVVGAVLGDSAADWFDRRWSRMSRRARLAFAVLAAATDGASWLLELPRSRQSWRGLADPLRLHTEPALGGLGEDLADLLRYRPDTGRTARGANPGGQYLGAWLDLGQALARRRAVLVKLARPDSADRLLTALARTLPGRGPPARVELLRRATRHVQRHTVIAAGRLFDVRLSGDALDLAPGSPLWNAVAEYEWAQPARRALAAYLRELVGTGHADAAGRAFRQTWSAWLAGTGEEVPRFADDGTPELLTHVGTRAEQTPVRVGATTDPVARLNLGFPNRHCLDCVTGQLRHLAETVVLHPQLVLLGAWVPRAGGGCDEELSQLLVMVTDQGILPVGNPHGGEHLGVGRMFGALLVEWAAATGLPLLKVVGQTHYYDPRLLPIPGFEAIEPEWLEITFPGVPGMAFEMWFDIADAQETLPHTGEWRVQRWVPRDP